VRETAEYYFGNKFPMTRAEFKSCFREAVRRLRPDLANNKANDEEFITIRKLYEDITKSSPSWAFTDGVTSIELRTTSGELLSDLGLGIGPLKNGKDCGQCGKKGFTEEQEFGWTRCVNCHGSGYSYSQPCRNCKSKGNYDIVTPTSRRTVECRSCHGKGSFPTRRIELCQECRGLGQKKLDKPKTVYHFCYTCNGLGEVEIFNPVIPKGRIVSK